MVNATALTGRKVATSDAYILGEVDGIEFDTESRLITRIRVLLSKQTVEDLSLEPPILWDVVISLPVEHVKKFGEKITLNVPLSEIAATAKHK